jgi:transcription initiation factor TFIID subunit TAF12
MATERWNDEMLDRLASTVGTLSLRMNDFQESIEQTNHNLEILIGAVNGVLARDLERQQEIDQLRQEAIAREERLREEANQRQQEVEAYRRENDQRFNILLEEIRFLIRREREE